MKKIVISILILLMLLIFITTSFASDKYICEDMYIEFSVPEGWFCIDKSTSPDDPILDKIGFDTDQVLKILDNEYIYVLLFNEDNESLMIDFTMTDATQKKIYDYRFLNDKKLENHFNEYEDYTTKSDKDATYTNIELYKKNGNIFFISEHYYDYKSERVYAIQLTTLWLGRYKNISLFSHGEKISAEIIKDLEFLIDSIHHDQELLYSQMEATLEEIKREFSASNMNDENDSSNVDYSIDSIKSANDNDEVSPFVLVLIIGGLILIVVISIIKKRNS